MPEEPDDVHTTVRAHGGLVQLPHAQSGRNAIDPPTTFPAVRGLRYHPSCRTLGQLERLARCRKDSSTGSA